MEDEIDASHLDVFDQDTVHHIPGTLEVVREGPARGRGPYISSYDVNTCA